MVLGALVAGFSLFILTSLLIFAVGYFLGNLKSTKKFVLTLNVFDGVYEEDDPDPQVEVKPVKSGTELLDKSLLSEVNKVSQIRKETK